MNTQLTTPERLRLKSAFSRWMKNPVFFSTEIRAAEKAIEDSEKYGWKLSVDRFGIPTAEEPKNLRLSSHELCRFHSRLDSMNEQEAASTRAALVAIGTRGFSAKVDSTGHLIAVPPKQVQRQDPDWQQKQREHKSYWAKHGGQSAFKTLPSKIL
jgi:hypothetical protein